MSDLKGTCPGCGSSTSAVGQAQRDWEPCPICDMSPEASHAARCRQLADSLMPRLMVARSQFGRDPNAYMLPSHLNPGPYQGAQSTAIEATIMGRPIIWGDRIGLVFDA